MNMNAFSKCNLSGAATSKMKPYDAKDAFLNQAYILLQLVTVRMLLLEYWVSIEYSLS